jgi:branched-chain amino acid transport system ATP-binding protein
LEKRWKDFSMLEVEHLETFYGHIQALRDLSLCVNEGEMACIIGANGAGKSTLLKSIVGLVKARMGIVKFLGKDLSSLATHQIVQLGMGLVPERRQLFGPLTVLDNLKLGAYQWFRRSEGAQLEEHLEWVYNVFPILRERRSQKAGTLSGGQQQMLAIGRSLMSRARLLLLDEPSLGLAPMVVLDIFRTLMALHQGGLTLGLVEQNAKLALTACRYGYILENGRIVLHGKTSDLLNDEKVKQAYLGKKKDKDSLQGRPSEIP